MSEKGMVNQPTKQTAQFWLYMRGQALLQWLSHPLWCFHSESEFLDMSPSSDSDPTACQVHSLGGIRWWVKYLGLCHPVGDPVELWAPSPSYCEHMGSEWKIVLFILSPHSFSLLLSLPASLPPSFSFSLSLSIFQINKTLNVCA